MSERASAREDEAPAEPFRLDKRLTGRSAAGCPTMMRNKRFDCVQMKWGIQRRLEEEMPGVPEAEKRRLQMERVAKDPLFGRFVAAARKGSGK